MSEITPTQGTLAEQRASLITRLERYQLGLQKIVLDTDQTNLESVQESIKRYKKGITTIQEERKAFTNRVTDLLITPMMQYEKQAAEYEGYKKLQDAEMNIKRKLEHEREAAEAMNKEIASFKIHCERENIRIETAYVLALSACYDGWIKSNIEAKNASPNFEEIKAQLKAIKPEAAEKFTTTLLTKEQMKELYAQVTPLDLKGRLKEQIDNFKEYFERTYQDMLKSDKAREQIQAEQAKKERELKEKAEAESAMATFVHQAEITVGDSKSLIKRSLVVEVVETDVWAAAVCAHFWANKKDLMKYIRVSAWSNLTIGQMATYLGKLATETGVTFDKLTMKEIEK